ncbi:N-acetylmuramoyl-L-alanine amidase [Nonomuraea sp. NPDC005650]|uniref:peptidoglycan recognition protein family protein n=1 Tax=Nonomuraea sp. NPDC005650 TaxID=3157045 RepID=UPI0033AF986E
MKTVLSPNRYEGRVVPIRLIVIHTMETGESPNVAENVANYFARRSTKASAHLCVDNDSAVRTVPDSDTAWAAPGANSDGLQMELAGRAGQGAAGWRDAYSKALLRNAARHAAVWCKKYGIPAKKLSRAELRAGRKGFIGHVDASAVYKRSDHSDPGSAFPWDEFLALVRAELDGGEPDTDDTKVFPKPPTAPRWPGRMLHYDPRRPLMTGHDVEQWQARLEALRYTITVDGTFGPMTSAATKVLQRDRHVADDGVVGPKTWAAAW